MVLAHNKACRLHEGHELDALCKEPDHSAVGVLCIPAVSGHTQLCSPKFDFSGVPDVEVCAAWLFVCCMCVHTNVCVQACECDA